MGLTALTGERVGSLDGDSEGWGRIRTPRGDLGASQIKERNEGSER